MTIILFVFGLVVGSFLNCLIYRLETDQGFVFGRSFCPKCKHRLSWLDLIPILSFVFLKGKCRYCQEPISWQYPLVELATAIIFVLVFIFTSNHLDISPLTTVSGLMSLVYLLFISSCLIAIFVFDLKHYLIPGEIVYSGIAVVFLYRLFDSSVFGFAPLFNPLAVAFLSALFFYIIYWFSRGSWMGFGDVLLAFFMGLFLGLPGILVALFSAFFSGAIIGIFLIISGKKKIKSEVPFGPFLAAGAFFALFWGSQIIDFYLGLFLW